MRDALRGALIARRGKYDWVAVETLQAVTTLKKQRTVRASASFPSSCSSFPARGLLSTLQEYLDDIRCVVGILCWLHDILSSREQGVLFCWLRQEESIKRLMAVPLTTYYPLESIEEQHCPVQERRTSQGRAGVGYRLGDGEARGRRLLLSRCS